MSSMLAHDRIAVLSSAVMQLMVDSRAAPDHRANRLLAALEPEDFAYLAPHLEIVDLAHGRVLHEPGATIYHAFFPLDSVISLVNVLEDGSSVEVAMFGREAVSGLVGEIATATAFGRYIVQVPGYASRISLGRLHDAIDTRPRIRQLLRHFAEALLSQTFQMVTCNAVHSARARCCRWILSTHDRLDQDTLPLTHEFLAEMLGVQRSTVSAITRSLQSTGLIVQGRGVITVTDRMGLESATCECYGKIRRSFLRLLPSAHPSVLDDR
jgi:CRP-like cAMP-binding protein